MAIFGPQNTATYGGGDSNDVFLVDPNDLGLNRITDAGGPADVLEIFDRPGRTSGDFVVEGGVLIWRPFTGDGEVQVVLSNGTSPIEILRRSVQPEDGDGPSFDMRIILDHNAITGRNFVVAGTAEDDAMGAPQFLTRQRGLSEMYGGIGNDILIGSNNHRVILYGGDGNDTIRGLGRQLDEMQGDAGNDRLFGGGGNDFLFGGSGRDTISGGTGRDTIEGGAGNDVLVGNTGADRFVFQQSAGNEGRDVIRGFTMGSDRVIMNGYSDIEGNELRVTNVNGDRATGDALVTLVETGTQLLLVGVSVAELFTDIQSAFLIT